MKVIAVTSVDSKQVVRDTLTERFGADVTEYAVAPLTDTEIDEIVKTFTELSNLNANPRSRELLRRLVVVDLLVRGRVCGVPHGDRHGKAKLPEHSRSVSRPFAADEFRASSPDRHGWIRILPEGHPSLLRASVSLRPGPQDAQERSYHQGRTERVLPPSSVGEMTLRLHGALTLIAKSSKHENAKQPHWAQARSSCWGTRSPPL